MPMWVDGPDGTPYRPWGDVWLSLETDLANARSQSQKGTTGRSLSTRCSSPSGHTVAGMRLGLPPFGSIQDAGRAAENLSQRAGGQDVVKIARVTASTAI